MTLYSLILKTSKLVFKDWSICNLEVILWIIVCFLHIFIISYNRISYVRYHISRFLIVKHKLKIYSIVLYILKHISTTIILTNNFCRDKTTNVSLENTTKMLKRNPVIVSGRTWTHTINVHLHVENFVRFLQNIASLFRLIHDLSMWLTGIINDPGRGKKNSD